MNLKIFLLFTMLTFVLQLVGQKSSFTPDKKNLYANLNDSLPQVIYKPSTGSMHRVAWFVDDQQIDEMMVKSINPETIASMNVLREAIQLDQVNYEGQVRITMKPSYKPHYISLGELKNSMTNLGESPALFFLDNELICGDNHKNRVDLNYILQVVVEKSEMQSEGKDIFLIRLLTRNPENSKKSKEIRLR